MDDCDGFAVTRSYSTFVHPAPVPDGYHEPPTTAPLQFTALNAFSCLRVGLGPLERPVTVVLLMASNALPPEPCMQGAGAGGILYVHRVWTNDTDLTALLGALGLPAETTDFSIERASPTQASWSWDDGAMALDFVAAENPSPGPTRNVRWVWLANGTTNYIDASYDYDTTGLSTVAVGNAPESYLDPAEPGAWSAPLISKATVRGDIRYFDSLDCSSS